MELLPMQDGVSMEVLLPDCRWKLEATLLEPIILLKNTDSQEPEATQDSSY